ncbi:thiamine diphosphokinase [Fervidibacillus albus]|uniref:Thiamine diphosphokinase n=1 Tax=Fervidibacillus albus TaxID=2980026 RepID=A0A9E8RVH0_9BACI|nr:thiamine diphosphokinase [Fervidibacillus albus]WAA10665.1 thiamine diphosphokinase [Fervidibacillus albus]
MEATHTIHIVAGGPKECMPDLFSFRQKGVFWMAVDKGVRYVLEEGIVPDVAIGDFDSISERERLEYEQLIPAFKKYNREKDETDLDLAVTVALQKNPEIIRIFGATGGRIDHLFANISLLTKPFPSNNTRMELIDRQNIVQVKSPGTYTMKKREDMKYVSFIPLSTGVDSLTLTGFKYPLRNRHIPFGSTLCISNELIEEYGTYSFQKGILLIVESSDGLGGQN